MSLHIKADNTPCPCILWVLSGRNPKEFHDARKSIEKEELGKGVRHGKASVNSK